MGLTTTTSGAVWMEKMKWNEFAEYYGLEFGSFLVFRFDGNSTFQTMIFGMDGTEIDYSSNFEDDDDDSDEQLKNRENNASIPSSQSIQKIRNQDSFCPKMEPQEGI